MTTNINITVGGNSLVDQAKAQQQAARTAKLLQDNQARIEAEAKAKRDAELARQGLAPDGTPLFGTQAQTRFAPDEPAANRQSSDTFANFFVTNYTLQEGIPVMQVTSGDGAVTNTIPWPTLEDFPDLLSPLPDGELRGVVIFGTERALRYDNLGRLLGSASTDPAEIYYPSKNDFFAFADGLVTFYQVQANYSSFNDSSTHILPTGKGNALVIIRTAILKLATTRIIRTDRDKYYSQVDFEQGIYECVYDTSPLDYKNVTFHVKNVEQFHVFAVSSKSIRYIGLAPQNYVNQFNALPNHKGFELSDLTITNNTVSTYDYFLRTNYSNCAPGDEPVDVSIPWNASYFAPDYSSNLQFNSLVTYKLIGQSGATGTTITPSVYTVFANPVFYPSVVSSMVTDSFVKSYLPAKAASLKWRTPSSDKTPYSYQGTPPAAWSTYSAGPFSIRTGFPDQWKKSGKSPNTTSGQGTPISVWDWGDPGYCRQQALALGFTEADLTP
jgi:hypothetical protein